MTFSLLSAARGNTSAQRNFSLSMAAIFPQVVMTSDTRYSFLHRYIVLLTYLMNSSVIGFTLEVTTVVCRQNKFGVHDKLVFVHWKNKVSKVSLVGNVSWFDAWKVRLKRANMAQARRWPQTRGYAHTLSRKHCRNWTRVWDNNFSQLLRTL